MQVWADLARLPVPGSCAQAPLLPFPQALAQPWECQHPHLVTSSNSSSISDNAEYLGST